MHQYLVDTELASRGIIELIGNDRHSLDDIVEQQRSALSKEASFDVAFMQRQMQPHANYWHGLLVEAAQDRMTLDQQIKVLEAEILDKRHSLSALAGSLLQIAKQGISSVYGKPQNSPAGRMVNAVELRDIIWAGRNQAQHYEEPKMINDTTEDVFSRLRVALGESSLSDPRSGENLAYQVVCLIGWSSYDAYVQDMTSLLG